VTTATSTTSRGRRAAAAVLAPLVVLAVVAWRQRWLPAMDTALMELRTRQVFSAHPPLVGIPGRFVDGDGNVGHHPGAIEYYVLAPLYRLFGGSARAFRLAGLALQAAAAVVAVRAGAAVKGRAGAWSAAATVLLVMGAAGPAVMSTPWNPYVPVLPWLAVVWCLVAVLGGAHRHAAGVVVLGAICAQVHISMTGPVLVGVAVTIVVLAARRARWLAAALAALFVVLWVPTIVDQLTSSPGNLGVLASYFTGGADPSLGLRDGLSLAVRRSDPLGLLRGDAASRVPTGAAAIVRGAVTIGAWAAVAIAARRRGDHGQRCLDAVIAGLLVVSVVSASRIAGEPWPYLTLWTISGTALLVVRLAAAAWSAARAGLDGRTAAAVRWVPAVAVALAAIVVAVDFARAAVPERPQSEIAAALAPRVVDGLGRLPDGCPAAPYLVEPNEVGGPGDVTFGLFTYLIDHGVPAKLAPALLATAGEPWVAEGEQQHSRLVVATGSMVDRWRATPGACEVAATDPPTDGERRERDQAMLEARLALVGRPDLAGLLDTNLFAVALAPDLPAAAREPVQRLLEQPLPAAVFAVRER